MVSCGRKYLWGGEVRFDGFDSFAKLIGTTFSSFFIFALRGKVIVIRKIEIFLMQKGVEA